MEKFFVQFVSVGTVMRMCFVYVVEKFHVDGIIIAYLGIFSNLTEYVRGSAYFQGQLELILLLLDINVEVVFNLYVGLFFQIKIHNDKGDISILAMSVDPHSVVVQIYFFLFW